MLWPVVIHKDEKSDYGVTVPDLPGCFSAGETMDEALANASEAILCHLEGMLADGEPWPAPGSIEDHQGNPDYAGGTWAVVSVDPARVRGKVKRVNITVPERLLARIDEYARAHGESRSGFLVQAALEHMAHG